jgi:F0F1-type ATP synthase delta subunit
VLITYQIQLCVEILSLVVSNGKSELRKEVLSDNHHHHHHHVKETVSSKQKPNQASMSSISMLIKVKLGCMKYITASVTAKPFNEADSCAV